MPNAHTAATALENALEEIRGIEVSDESSERLADIISCLERQLDDLQELLEEEESRYDRENDDVSDDEL